MNDDDGNLSGVGPAEQIGDLVWRVASASAQVAQAATLVPRKADHKDHAFEREVAEALREREVPVEHRRRKLVGQSERVHKVTFYVPERNAVLEPVTAHWNSASNVYTRLGDLGRAQANGNGGYGLFSIVDDKRAADAEKIEQLLAQVSNVVPWTQHEEWLAGLTSSRGT
ncbi:MAG: hypothetical protein QOE06_2816 [Thermoleophilaceae bacterium]|nr:hypothetical protein [Thermoleophilaceae bacterium]